MTDTITTDTQDTASEQGGMGTLEHIDPHALALETNVRDEVDVDADFLASINEHGVLIPIAGVRGEDGEVWVRAGQRRTLAARSAGLSTVPVYVRPAAASDEKTQVVERVTEQIVENDQRRQLTDAQRVRGIQQMLDAGLSVTTVAKKLSVAKDTVKAAGSAAKSNTAMQALSDGQLSLAEAAALTEFESVPGAVDRLIQVAGSRRFEHTVAQLREERASAEAEAQAAQRWTERGFTVLAERPESWDEAYIPLHFLVTAVGDGADEQAVTDPAHWAVLLYEDTALCDAQSGEIVDDEAVDWQTEDQADATPAEGLRHANTVTETTVFAPEYFCLDYRAAGLTPDSRFARFAAMGDVETDPAVDLDDQARAEARQKAQADREETEKRTAGKRGHCWTPFA